MSGTLEGLPMFSRKTILLLASVAVVGSCRTMARSELSEGKKTMSESKKDDKSDLKKRLSPLQYEVTQCSATEPPFRNEFWNNKEAGIYVDVVSGEPLFSSLDKFDSGTGWPSFTKPLKPAEVVERADNSHGRTRVEVRSKKGDSHLGHVFDDGPGPKGQRFCINSASLRFVPVARLAAEGFGEYLSLFGAASKPGDAGAVAMAEIESVVLAGGCFWGMQELLRKIPGVTHTEVGYSGGRTENATYATVKGGETGHAEAVLVKYDPKRLSFEKLLGFFFRMHDPTTSNRQGNDIGTQYRSSIFFSTDEQRRTAERVKAEVDKSGKWKSKGVTEIAPAGRFYRGEDYHQDYLQKTPGGYTCHFLRD